MVNYPICKFMKGTFVKKKPTKNGISDVELLIKVRQS